MRHNVCLAIVVHIIGLSNAPADASVWPSGREVVSLQARPFDLREVRLLDGPFREAMLRNGRYLHDLESDRLLWHFRRTAGLPTPGESMGGWEKTEFHNDRTLWVNQFIASELTWRERGVTVRQDTTFPDTSATKLTIRATAPTEFELRLRVPQWATEGVTLKIDGQDQAVTAQNGSFLSIRRTWRDETTVEMQMPMCLWLCPMPDDPDLAAVMYGPLVLAGELGKVDVPRDLVYATGNWFEFPADRIVEAPVMVVTQRDPRAWIRPVEDRPLAFRTSGAGRPSDVILVPYHRLFDQHYAVYWLLTDEAGWKRIQSERSAREAAKAREAARQAARAARTIDAVEIGVAESEQAHRLKGENTRDGKHAQRRWQDAERGWFEYELGVLPEVPVTLHCTYWGSDSGRVFDILVNGTRVATQELAQNQPGEFFDIEYAMPVALTQGRKSVVVRFVAHPGSTAGGLFACATLKADR